jgi:hypothetical protein
MSGYAAMVFCALSHELEVSAVMPVSGFPEIAFFHAGGKLRNRVNVLVISALYL